jgi:hypothetical protein
MQLRSKMIRLRDASVITLLWKLTSCSWRILRRWSPLRDFTFWRRALRWAMAARDERYAVERPGIFQSNSNMSGADFLCIKRAQFRFRLNLLEVYFAPRIKIKLVTCSYMISTRDCPPFAEIRKSYCTSYQCKRYPREV